MIANAGKGEHGHRAAGAGLQSDLEVVAKGQRRGAMRGRGLAVGKPAFDYDAGRATCCAYITVPSVKGSWGMKRRVLTIVIAVIAMCGAVASYAFLTELWAVVSIAAISACTVALLYLVWSPKRDKAATPNFGVAAVTSITTLCSGPIWAGLLKTFSSNLEEVGVPAQYLNSFAREFFATTLVAIFAIVIIVWLLRKDDTISGRQVGDLSKDIGEIGFKQKLDRIAQVLKIVLPAWTRSLIGLTRLLTRLMPRSKNSQPLGAGRENWETWSLLFGVSIERKGSLF
jgi:hypothetical protein